MNYKVIISGANASESGHINFPVDIQAEVQPGVWESVPLDDQRYLSITSENSDAIMDSPMTDPEKRSAVVELLKNEMRAWIGIAKSYDSLIKLETILPPSGWPVTINL